MGTRRRFSATLCRLCLSIAAALAVAAFATPALAASPLKVREAFPGSSVYGAAAEYVTLQMNADGQGDIDGQVLRFYDKQGVESSTFTIPSDVANGQSQRTVLLATQEAVDEGLASAPDFNLGSGQDRLDPIGGAVCLTGAIPADCVTWGSIPLFDPFSSFPDRQSANAAAAGIPNGLALRRSIASGCSTYLDAPDDTASSAANFAAQAPNPRPNATAPVEQRCPPGTAILTFPANLVSSTAASFTFAEFPSEQSASFECEIDGDGSFAGPETSACNAGSASYTSLAQGLHVFRVRATGENPTPGPAAAYSWVVDTIPPQTAILNTPPEPSSGAAAPFTYSSSEPNSGFRCQLDDGAIQVCAATGRTYFALLDGTHTFRVWAVDNAGNQDPSPALHEFTVDTSLEDHTPPDTSILVAPSSPSASGSAFFAYASSESPATYQCSLDQAGFAPCPGLGIEYSGLRNGTHTFAVRGIDRAGNVDSVPAELRWQVAAPAPETRIVRAPAGRVRARSNRRAKVVFRFASSELGSTFRCRLDKRPFRSCASPESMTAKIGRHRFEVYAVDPLGNVETTPVRRIFRVAARGGQGFRKFG